MYRSQALLGSARFSTSSRAVIPPTCAMSIRQFNVKANGLRNTVVVRISAAPYFAQARFCGAEGHENVVALSMLRGREFLENYGVAITSVPLSGLATRAVVVLDQNDQVIYRYW